MAKHRTFVHLPHREPMAQGVNALLVLGVAAFVLGVMVSRGVRLSPPAVPLVATTPATLGRVERWVPAREERAVATMPLAHLVSPTLVLSTASSGGTGVVAACSPRLALDGDLRLGLIAMALQQRGFLLGGPAAPAEQDVPQKYRALARAEESVASTTASLSTAPPPNDPGC